MNDELLPDSGDPVRSDSGGETDMQPAPESTPAADDGPRTAGGLIRHARQEQGLDLASLAAMLKVPLKKLEALEQGRHEDLPGQTFERALAQAACRVLKIDPKPVLDLMPRLGSNTLEHVGGGINAPFREQRGHGEHAAETSRFMRPVYILPVLLVIGALVLLYAPDSLWERIPRFSLGGLGGGASAPAPAASGGVGTAGLAAPGGSAAEPAPGPATASAGTTAGTGASGIPAPAEASTAAAQAGGQGVATAPAAPATPAPAAAPSAVDEVAAHAEAPPTIPLQVTAAEDSWIEVVDAQGHTLLSRTVVAGESVGLDGALPMKVKVGNAKGTRLSLRGENVDLAPWTRDNIARLVLK
jgi:cytoskeleton protein RodZ